MTIAYCLSYEYLNYSHREEIVTSTDKEAILERYQDFVAQVIEDDSEIDIDYISVEEVEDDIYGDVIAETTFVEPYG